MRGPKSTQKKTQKKPSILKLAVDLLETYSSSNTSNFKEIIGELKSLMLDPAPASEWMNIDLEARFTALTQRVKHISTIKQLLFDCC